MAHNFLLEKVISKTSDFFSSCLTVMGREDVAEICHRSEAQVYRYARDMSYRSESYQNPADVLLALMPEMEKRGRHKHNVELLRLLADSIGCDIIEKAKVTPDKDTVGDEMLDDLAPLADLHEAIRRGRSVATIKALASVVKQEVDEDVAAYKQEVTRNEAG